MWPDDRDLPVEVEAAFGADLTADSGAWSWTDLSSRLRAAPIQLRAGRSGGAGQVSPGTCSVTLDNDDSALTPLHPMSTYWPNVEIGTPLRVRLRRAEDAFARTASNGWDTADSGQVWSHAGGSPSDFSVSGGAGRHAHTTVNALRRTILDATLLDCEQEIDVAPSVMLTGAALVTGALARMSGDQQTYYWLRAEFNSGGSTLQLKISKTVNGVETQLASLNPVPSLAYAANTAMRVVASVVGSRLAIKVWNPVGPVRVGWHLSVTDTSITTAGRPGLQSWLVGGNTNTLPVTALHKNYAVRVDRFNGFADQWEPTYLPTGVVGEMYSAVRVTCSGVLRRFQQGSQLAASAMRRTIVSSGALAYWPVEDGTDASVAASAIPGHRPLTITGVAEFATLAEWLTRGYTVNYGTGALADLSDGGQLQASVAADVTAATTTGWTVALVADVVDPAVMSANMVLAEAATPGGSFVRWQLVVTKTSRTQVIAYNSAGAATTVVDDSGAFVTLAPWDFAVWQNGANISVGYGWRSVGGYRGSGSVAGTLAGVTEVTVNPTGVTSTSAMPFGHIAVWADRDLPVVDYNDGGLVLALFGYGWTGFGTANNAATGEPATDRLARLAAEDGLTLDMPDVDPAEEVMMGWQQPATPLDLYRECEDADGGILHERGFNLAYLPRTARYNQPVDLTIDLATYATSGGDVLAPVYDDQGIRNQWTVGRRDGSSAVANDPVSQRRGVYSDSVELNLASDEQLADHAAWRVHLGTVVDLRESTFPIDLAANPDLIDGWLSCGVGSRIVRTNPPAQYRPGDLDRLVEGWSETIGPRSWMVQVTPSPASPWGVAAVDGEQRVAADGSYLAAGAAMDDTTLLVATPVEAAWTTDPADLPLDIQHAGERMTVTAITPRVAPGFVATGTGTNGSNTSRVPALPAGWAQGDLLLIYATARSTPDHRAVAPDGYLTLFQDRNVALFGKPAAAAEVAPTVTFVGGVANADTIAQMAAFRGVAPGVMASATQLNASAQNIAFPALSVPQPALILYLGWRQDDWTSVAALAGATEVGSRSSTLGDDAAQVWDYTIQASQANIAAGQFVVTGGLPAVSRGAVVALWANVQQMTVMRGVNGVRKAHPPSSGSS